MKKIKVTKVFTTYDAIIATIYVPYILHCPSEKNNPLYNFCGTKTLTINKITEGLEGVKFVQYKEVDNG